MTLVHPIQPPGGIVVQKTEAFNLLGIKIPSGESFEVVVAAEHLVSAFPRKHNVHTLVLCISANQIVGGGASHQGWIKGLEVIDNLGQRLEKIIESDDQLMMLTPDMPGRVSSVLDILALADAKGL